MTGIQIGSKEAIYFAYGTLLELDEMHRYCPSARSLGIYRLKNFCLGFRACRPDPTKGGCTLVDAPKNIMYGILYKMPVEDRRNLDQISGIDQGLWAVHKIFLLDKEDNRIAAETYVIPKPSGPYIPPISYTRPILAGARQIPLPRDYIEQLEGIIKGDKSK